MLLLTLKTQIYEIILTKDQLLLFAARKKAATLRMLTYLFQYFQR